MSKGDGGGVSIVPGWRGMPATGEKRQKLTRATEIDAHRTKKVVGVEARAKAESARKRAKLLKVERQADKEARKRYREAPKEVIVEHRVGGELKSTRKIERG